MRPLKSTTPMQWRVIGFLFIAIPFCAGLLFLWLGNNPEAGTIQERQQVFEFGLLSIGASIVALIVWKIVKRFL